MATAPAALPKITKLPSGPIRRALHFDQHVGVRPKYPVSARFAADGDVESPGISFEDYGRMGTTSGSKLNNGREEETPPWALDDVKLRTVLVHYVEARAGLLTRQIGSEVERLQRAQQKILAMKPLHELTLTNLAREYVEMKKSGVDAETLRKQAVQIENLDTRLLHTENFAAKALMALHLYYKMGWNSVQVGCELHLKPTHIRQMMYRIRKVAWKLGLGEKPRIGTRGGCRRIRLQEPARRKTTRHVARCRTVVVKVKRDTIVRSAEFVALFEKARTGFRDPNRKTCKHGHPICAANAHVGDLRRTGKYSCDPCNRRIQKDYKASHPSQ